MRAEAQGKNLDLLLDTGSNAPYLDDSGVDFTVRPARGLPKNRLGFDALKPGGAVDFRAMVVVVE